MEYVIFAGGDISSSDLIKKVLQQADIIIAADGGVNSAVELGCIPSVVIGDFDSVKPSILKKLQKEKTQLFRFPAEKDETDTELALDYAVKHGAEKIIILGGTAGDRFDHIMANVFLALTSPIPLQFINGNQIAWIEKGPVSCSIVGKKGDLLSLIPLAEDVVGVTLSGLQYGLKNETLFFGRPRGVSNVFVLKKATMSFTKGTLLCIHTVL